MVAGDGLSQFHLLIRAQGCRNVIDEQSSRIGNSRSNNAVLDRLESGVNR